MTAFKKKKGGSKKAKKSSYFRGKSYAKTGKVIAAPGVGLGQSIQTVLKTCWYRNCQPNATTGVFQGYISPGDPVEPTGTFAVGIQPALLDKWFQAYARCTVLSAFVKIEASRLASGSQNDVAFVVAAYPTTQLNEFVSYQSHASQRFAKTLLCGVNDNTTSNTMTFKLDHRQVLGLPDKVDPNDSGAVASSSPPSANYMKLRIFLQNCVPSNEQISLKFTMYQTVLFDRRLDVIDA